MKNLLFPLLLLSLTACNAPAPAATSGLAIEAAYAAPSPEGVDIAAGYLTIVNHGAEERLLSASSPRAANVALHTMEMDGVVMRMRMVESLIIPANGELALSSGGDHLMFTGLTAPFAVGETIPVQLHFEHAGDIDVALPVSSSAPHSAH